MDRWLLLTFQLRSRPSHVRVKTWRRLQQVGALSRRKAVYVLPNTEQCREDFEWIRAEIVTRGGEATVFAAQGLAPGTTDEELVASFNAGRGAAYRDVKKDLDRLLSRIRRSRRVTPALRRSVRHDVGVARERLDQIARIDFFGAPGRDEAQRALASIEAVLLEKGGSVVEAKEAGSVLDRKDFQGRCWVTRPRPGVDRMASAWLIRRHLDPRATFEFADAPVESAVAFDMYGGAFTHEGSRCTFEAIVHRFGIAEPAVGRIAGIVHDLDMNDAKYAPPEAPAVGRIIDGLRKMYVDDHALMEQGVLMFEALARSFGASAASTVASIDHKP